MFPSACFSLVIFYVVQLCVAFHYQHLGIRICNLKGGVCLPSDASTCNTLDAECDEGNICCEESTTVPIKKMAALPITKHMAVTCSNKPQDFNSNSGSIALWSKYDYDNFLDCEWQITVDVGYVILIEWVKFDIEYHAQCDYDYVDILGQKFCGYDMPDSITTSNNQVWVKFHSDFSVRKKGFSLIYSSVRPTITTTTTPTSTVSTGCGIVNRQIRIVGGEETLLHEYPWQVAVMYDGYYNGIRPWCGGSIISRKWILTAAHCLNKKTTSNIQVVVGEHDWSTSDETMSTIRVDTELLVMHPNYVHRTLDNDIALIKLSSQLAYTQANGIAPVCLPPVDSQDPFENIDAIVSGWGFLSHNGVQPNILNGIIVPTMSNAQCQQKWEYDHHIIWENMICTGLPKSNKGPYHGDSGGPLVTEVNGHMVQIGVVSWGSSKATPGYPDVYTRVTSHMPWILRYLDDDA